MLFDIILASAAPWGYPRAPRGVPKVALKVRRSILHQFWGPFWHHLGSFFAPFLCNFGVRFLIDFLMPFWFQDGAISSPFWGDFWNQKMQKIRSSCGGAFEVDFGKPWAPSEVQNHWKRWESCLKSKVDVLAPERLRGRFCEPKWSQKRGQKHRNSIQKSIQNSMWNFNEFRQIL